MVEEKQRELRVVVFPWLAHGHITPFVELAKRLTSHGLKVFFVSTPMNIKLRVKPQVWDAPGIDLIELPMPSVEGLPTGVESSADVVKRPDAPLILPLLTVALDLLEKPFEALVRQLSPDFVMYDVLQYWVPRVAAKQANPVAPILFIPPGVTGFSYIEGVLFATSGNPIPENMTVSLPGFPSPNIHFNLFDAQKAMEILYCKQPGGLNIAERGSICLRESWAVACSTCLELEGVYIEYLQSLVKRPVYPVGMLMRKLPPLPVDDICLQWLDRQLPASVVFLSFGSEYSPTNEQFAAISMGLQESNVSFLWLLPAGNALAQGFQDQIGDKGLLVTKWAPQLNILNHASTGAFLTHCGRNSMIEGLWFGLPLINVPMQFEQGLNAKLAQELKVGIEVRRNEKDGSFTKDDISEAIRVIMIEEEGAQIKRNAKKISDMFSSNNFQVNEKDMKNFVSILKTFNK